MEHDFEAWPCMLCDRPSRWRVHPGCQRKVDENLAALPALYRALEAVLHPGRRGGDGRMATRSAPIPGNLDVLDLRARGGIEGMVSTWARDLWEREGWDVERFPEYGSVEAAVDAYTALLRNNLTAICDDHPAVREFADEIRKTAGQARSLITGEKPERRIGVVCTCGAVLRITLSTPGKKCGGCGEHHGFAALRHLDPAPRTAA